MSARAMTLLTAALAIAALAVGCGGDDDQADSPASVNGGAVTERDSNSNGGETSGSERSSAPVTTSSLNKPAFVKNANAICRRERARLLPEMNAYLKKQGSDGTASGAFLADMFRAVFIPSIEREMEAIRGLGAPAGDRQEVEAILVAQEAAVEEMRSLESLSAIFDLGGRFAKADAKLQDYGLTGCVRES